MRTLKTFFLSFCFCILALVVGHSSFAGNGVERGSGWIEWEDVASVVRPDLRLAVENSIKTEAPQLLQALNGDLLIVDSIKVVGGSSGLSDQGNSVMELTMRLSSDESSRFKVRMSMEYPQGFMNHDGRTKSAPEAKILEWVGVEAVFGTNLGLKNAR